MILASELTHRTLWYPTILGVLVVVAGVVLFCGSVYLLLGTNLGARLGFLVAFTGLAGFMVILSALWCTTASPRNTLKGRDSAWKVQQVIADLDKAKVDQAKTIDTKQNKLDEETESSEIANVKAAVDAALVTKVDLPTAHVTENDNRYAKFDDVTKYMILQTWEVGGSNPQFWKGELTHQEKVAVMQFCEVADQPDESVRAFGLPPLPPECMTGGEKGYIVLVRDLGSLRLPPFVAFVVSSILFLLGLLMLHWRERDEQEAAQAAAAPPSGSVPERVPAGV
jgi:hypothetical protein